MTRQLFFDLLRTSVVVGLAALALAAASPLWDRRFAARWKSGLWCVLAALLLAGPFLRLPEGTAPWTISVPGEVLVERDTGEYVPTFSPAFPVGDIGAQLPEGAVQIIPGTDDGAAAPDSSLPSVLPVTETVDLLTLAELVWGLGVLAFALRQLGGELVFRRRVRRWGGPVQSAELLVLYQDTLPELSHPPLLVCPGIGTPMLAGLLRPRLLLPREDYTAAEAACIFRHELTHWRRGDLWRKLLLLAANGVHWFNPVVWLLRRAAEQDMERACDEQVVRGAALSERRAYGAVLLAMARTGNGPALSTHLSSSAKKLKKRLEHILSADTKGRGAVPAAVCALLTVCAVVLVACASRPAAETEIEQPSPTEAASAEPCRVLILGRTDAESFFYDTLLLLTYDPAAPSLDVLSLPRDTYVESLPWDVKQLRTVSLLEDGGYDITVQDIISDLTGTEVDYTVRLDAGAVARLVDAVGGVECEVPMDMDYDDPYQDLSIHLNAGCQRLSGEQAMGLLRFRKGNDPADSYRGGDLDRIAVQQAVMEAIAEQLPGKVSLTELSELVRLFRESVSTDLTAEDLLRLGRSYLTSGLTAADMTFRTLDGKADALWSETYQNHLTYWFPGAPAAPVSYAYDASLGDDVYIETARQLLSKVFSFDPDGLTPSVDASSTLLSLWYTPSENPQDVSYLVEFYQDLQYPRTLYRFDHPLEEGVDIAEDPDFVFDTEMLSRARDFVKIVYGVDCSNAEAHVYGYQNKISVQLQSSEDQIFHVRFYYESAEPTGIVFFDSAEHAQLVMDTYGARCFF